MKHQKQIELLAPAKDLVSGKEAILHGADAVYIGAPKFSARAAAGNSVEDIRQLCEFAHIYDARIYIALNTILKDEELKETEKLIGELYRAGADALIVQDMGIAMLDIPPIPLHASTQMDNRTVEKVRFLEDSGFDQVVLARELALPQIREIAENTSVNLEVFVHGALCVSYSGLCYLSAALSGRSANRGECAQYCRLPYDLVDRDDTPILSQKHLLSLKDMNRSADLEALLDAGVSSFKIEGRLKDVSYVKNITAYYRKRLDAILARRPEYRRSSAGESRYTFEPVPEKSFNRGFTSYWLDRRSQDITSFDTPKSIGEAVGTVKEIKGNSFTVAGVKSLHNGDGLVFFNPQGELDGFRVNRVEDNRVFPAEMPTIQPKTPLYRNMDQEFEKLLDKPSATRKIAVDITFADYARGFTLAMTDETGARVEMPFPCEKEEARSDQRKNIETQLTKLGNTPFEARDVRVSLTKNWFIPSSVLNEMRRQLVDRLLMARRMRYPALSARPIMRRNSAVAYPQTTLSYQGNVYNEKAASFYALHGVEAIEPAFEKENKKEVPLMFTKHCLRYSLGWCPVWQKKASPYQEPYFLVYKGNRLRLAFDCKACEMKVFLDESR
ncbi:collagenase-like PrtC family protease [Parabacteroides sp. PFB2-12]|uniref:peptidase U32 family protein n=1 Tax=unclassified Parabacteroides TaxID=2649774 RepID=UPI0024746096|nr:MULTISPECIES: U32 family peptidase [unclassified Parabacteroides]MDH6342861.1 collagenase-like PrtC family protease [Parabacteroides sp. PM6-13]MDH6390509.1 collagenase-like PrtC family protease [Parabacteroides sp. PFB2-12]